MKDMKNAPPAAAAEVIVHGITNCDTVRLARGWLDRHGVVYRFHDFKKHGVPADQLANWMAELGWERLLNRQGTTWRKLDDNTRSAIEDAASAADLMKSQPSVIKRPVINWSDGDYTVGFDADAFARRAAA